MSIFLKKNLIILLVILFAGLLLRTVFITSSPPSLYGDELTITLDAYSLLRTGRDQLGNFLPLTFQMGAGRPAGYVYGSIPFIAVFGPNEYGVRSLSILSGVGIILLLFLIIRRLFSEKTALYAGVLASVSPWAISLSRGGFEANFALFLSLSGIYFFLKATEKPLMFLLSFISFGLALHTYPTYKVSLVLFLPLLIFFTGISHIRRNKKFFVIGLLVFFMLGILALSQTFVGGSEKRFAEINIFSQNQLRGEIEQKINSERQLSTLPQNLSKYFHNKPLEYGKVLLENYLQNFSLDFLVLHGDRNPRHNMATMGEIYLAEFVLIISGLVAIWLKSKKTLLFLLSWLALAPIGTSIIGLPHALRSSFMLPSLLVLSSIGLAVLIKSKKQILIFFVSAIFLIQFIFFLQKLYFLSPALYGNFWSYPAKLASEHAVANKENFDFIFLSDSIDSMEFAYPVYAKEDAGKIIAAGNDLEKIDSYSFRKYGNVYIGAIPDGDTDRFLLSLNASVLYIGPSRMQSLLEGAETINGKDNLPVLALRRYE